MAVEIYRRQIATTADKIFLYEITEPRRAVYEKGLDYAI